MTTVTSDNSSEPREQTVTDPAMAEHGRRVLRSIRNENLRFLGLASPAFLLVLFLLVLPVLWLFFLSVYENGGFTLRHYARMLEDPSYARSLWLTLQVSLAVTGLCVLLGYPLAYMLAQSNRFWATLGLTLVIIPFWTSLLVRTYAWLVLLQNRGIVNNLLMQSGLIEQRLYLVHNMSGTIVGMLHIMLPFLVLPLYATMKGIDPELMRAARSLGAGATYSFWRIFFPLSAPGLLAGALLVFVMSIGFYITPAVLGGGKTILIAMLIERNVNLFFEWGAASSVAVVCMVAVLALFWISSKVFSLEKLFGAR